MVRFLIAAVIFLVSSSDITRAQGPSSEPQDSPPIIDDAVEQRTKLDFLSGKRPTREDVAKELVKEQTVPATKAGKRAVTGGVR